MRVQAEPAQTVESHIGVSEVPEATSALLTLGKLDYGDLFIIETPHAHAHSAETWARAVLERAPISRRNARVLWTFIGLRMGPAGSSDYVQGWKIAHSEHNWIRLETKSWYLSAEAVCVVDDDKVSLSLSLRYDRPEVAHIVWRFVSSPHQKAVPVMLRQASQLLSLQPPSGTRC